MTAKETRPAVSVVAPARNEARNLPFLVEEVQQVLGRLDGPFELIIVNDGSTDSTADVLDELAALKPFVRAIHFDANYGQTSAFDAGIQAARGGQIVLMDADGQNDPADIPSLLAQLEHHDLAVGWRVRRKDPWAKKLTGRLANAVRRWATGDTTHDTGCSLKAFRADLIKRVKLYRGMHRFFSTLVALEGGSVVEVPVSHRPRRFGRSNYSIFNRALRTTLDLLAVMWMRRKHLRYRIRNNIDLEGDRPRRAICNQNEKHPQEANSLERRREP